MHSDSKSGLSIQKNKRSISIQIDKSDSGTMNLLSNRFKTKASENFDSSLESHSVIDTIRTFKNQSNSQIDHIMESRESLMRRLPFEIN